MGSNQSGVRRTARMKRHKQMQMRLAAKAAAASGTNQTEGLTAKATKMAKGVAEKVGGAFHTAVEKVKSIVK